jgi:hypothetical protein
LQVDVHGEVPSRPEELSNWILACFDLSKEKLVGGLEHEFYDFPYIGNIIIPTDEFIFFRGVVLPPTR